MLSNTLCNPFDAQSSEVHDYIRCANDAVNFFTFERNDFDKTEAIISTYGNSGYRMSLSEQSNKLQVNDD